MWGIHAGDGGLDGAGRAGDVLGSNRAFETSKRSLPLSVAMLSFALVGREWPSDAPRAPSRGSAWWRSASGR